MSAGTMSEQERVARAMYKVNIIVPAWENAEKWWRDYYLAMARAAILEIRKKKTSSSSRIAAPPRGFRGYCPDHGELNQDPVWYMVNGTYTPRCGASINRGRAVCFKPLEEKR